MQELSNIEHKVLEADIERLAVEVRKHRESPELKNLGDREIIKKSLQSLTTAAPLPAPAQNEDQSPLPAYARNAPAETKLEIEYLLELVFHEGLDKANSEAKKSSPFVLDAFHDSLVSKFYPELQKRGILK